MNSFTDFSQNLRTKSKQCQPQQVAWKKIRSLHKQNLETNSQILVSDYAESKFRVISQCENLY